VRWAMWLLGIVIAVELMVAAVVLLEAGGRPEPPLPDLSRLDARTAADLLALRKAAMQKGTAEWRALGEGYMAFGYFPEAVLCYRRADELQPETFETLYAWGFCLERSGRIDEAVAKLEAAAGLAETSFGRTCWYHIGRCYLRQENVKRAEAAFLRAEGLPPARLQRARIMARTGRGREALELLTALNEQTPGAVRVLQLKASIERDLADSAAVAKTLEQLEWADDLVPVDDSREYLDPIRFRFGLSRDVLTCAQLRESGGAPAVADCYQRIVRENDDSSVLRILPELAQLEIERERPEEAVRLLDRFFLESHATPEAVEHYGDGLYLAGRTREGVAAWRRAARLRATSTVHAKLANHFQQTVDKDSAKHHQAEAARCAGIDAFRNGDLSKAGPALEAAVEMNPPDDRAWYYLGRSHFAAGRSAEARTAYERALVINANYGRAAAALEQLRSTVDDLQK
jgi:tetratricopeptide (TPR) repeat protein